LAFKDIEPKTPVHVLIISKKHIPAIPYIGQQDRGLVGQMLLAAKIIAEEQGVAKTGYRLVFNVGDDAGQTVDHLHLHLMGGEKLPWS
jgi:histidine triad (HIT) family protein